MVSLMDGRMVAGELGKVLKVSWSCGADARRRAPGRGTDGPIESDGPPCGGVASVGHSVVSYWATATGRS